MAARKIGKSWYADVTWSGKRYRKRSPWNTKQGARELEQLIVRTLVRDGNLDALGPKKQDDVPLPTFAEFAERWMRVACEPEHKYSGVVTKYGHLVNHLFPVFGSLPLDGITSSRVARFKAERLGRGLKKKTVNNILSTLSSCLRTARDWGEIEELPTLPRCKGGRTPRARFLSENEVQGLVRAAEHPWDVTILFAARTGLRVGELAGLDWSDLRFRDERAYVEVSKGYVRRVLSSTKTDLVRYVMVPHDAATALLDLRESVTNVDGPMFQWKGSRFTYGTAQHYLYKACDVLGIERIGWHVLRHTYASELVQRGASLASVQTLLGHTKVEMTRRYAHLAPDFLEATVALLDPPDARDPRHSTGKKSADGPSNCAAPKKGSEGLSLNKAKTAPMGCGRNVVDREGFENG